MHVNSNTLANQIKQRAFDQQMPQQKSKMDPEGVHAKQLLRSRTANAARVSPGENPFKSANSSLQKKVTVNPADNVLSSVKFALTPDQAEKADTKNSRENRDSFRTVRNLARPNKSEENVNEKSFIGDPSASNPTTARAPTKDVFGQTLASPEASAPPEDAHDASAFGDFDPPAFIIDRSKFETTATNANQPLASPGGDSTSNVAPNDMPRQDRAEGSDTGNNASDIFAESLAGNQDWHSIPTNTAGLPVLQPPSDPGIRTTIDALNSGRVERLAPPATPSTQTNDAQFERDLAAAIKASLQEQ